MYLGFANSAVLLTCDVYAFICKSFQVKKEKALILIYFGNYKPSLKVDWW